MTDFPKILPRASFASKLEPFHRDAALPGEDFSSVFGIPRKNGREVSELLGVKNRGDGLVEYGGGTSAVTVADTVKQIFIDKFGEPDGGLDRYTPMRDFKFSCVGQPTLSFDSLDAVELVMELEDEFEIIIPDDDYDKLKTLGNCIEYVEQASAKK